MTEQSTPFSALKDQIKLVILVEGDEALLNYMSLIPVNPQKLPEFERVESFTRQMRRN